MGILLIATVATAGGIYYMSRLAPRVASRMAGAAASAGANAGGAAGSGWAGAASSAFQSATQQQQYRLPYHAYEHGFLPSMTTDEAMLILGFNDRVGSIREVPVAEIKERHRMMMKGHHSDVNGSPYLASKINEARSVLLNGRKA